MSQPTSLDHAVVLGAPRSGTTFLMSVLDGLPEAECVTGNLFPIAFAHLAARPLPTETREVVERGFRAAFRDYADSAVYRSRWGALRKWWLASRRPSTLAAARRGVRVERTIVYKEPFLSFAPELAYEALPGSRLIYLVRDGRDVADSLVRKYDVLSDAALRGLETNEAPLGRRLGELFIPWWVEDGEEDAFAAADQYVRAIWMWREMNARCGAFFEREDVKASGRVLTVRYEELMADPVGRGREVIEHIGGRINGRARERLERAHTRSLGIHRRLDRDSLQAAEAVAGSELRRLGYDTEAAALAG